MKRIIVAAILIIILISCTSEKNSFIGEWSGTSLVGEKMTIIFDADGYVTLIDGKNNVVGGKDFKTEGKVLSLKYAFNMTKEPVWLDVITVTDGKETTRDKAIVKLIGKNRMQFRMSTSQERPTDFEGGDTILLTKVN